MTDSKIKLRQSSTFNSPLQGLNFQFCWRPLGRAFVKGNPIYFPEELVGSVMRVSRIMRIIPSSSRIDRVSAFVHLGPRLKSEWYFDLLFTKVSYHQTEFPWECKRSKCRWKQRYSIDWGTSCLPYISCKPEATPWRTWRQGRLQLPPSLGAPKSIGWTRLRKTIPKDFERYDLSKRRQGLFWVLLLFATKVCGRLKDLMKRKLENGKAAYCKRVTWQQFFFSLGHRSFASCTPKLSAVFSAMETAETVILRFNSQSRWIGGKCGVDGGVDGPHLKWNKRRGY